MVLVRNCTRCEMSDGCTSCGLEGTYLDTVASVDMRNTLVVFPHDTELDDTFGDLNDIQSSLVGGIGFEEGLQTLSELVKSLFEFWFRWIDHANSSRVVVVEGKEKSLSLKDEIGKGF